MLFIATVNMMIKVVARIGTLIRMDKLAGKKSSATFQDRKMTARDRKK